MRLAVSPTRMELLRLRKRVALARRGHKLLKDKQDVLMRRFLTLIKEAKALREELHRMLLEGFEAFLMARSTMAKECLDEALICPREGIRLSVSTLIIIGVVVPKFELEERPDPFSYGFIDTSGQLDISLQIFQQALPLLVKVAEAESHLQQLSEEIERTRRRVNMLEFVFIPNLQETIRYITMKLSEMERANLTRLMRVKEIVRSH